MAVSALVAFGVGASTAATIVTVMTAIGTVMTVVGAVTGNKTLMKIGGIIGIVGAVGAIGSMASGAAAAGAAGSTGASAAGSVAVDAMGPALESSLYAAPLNVGSQSISYAGAVPAAMAMPAEVIQQAALSPVDSIAQTVTSAPTADINGLDASAYQPTITAAPDALTPTAAPDGVIAQTPGVNSIASTGVNVQAPTAPGVQQAGVPAGNTGSNMFGKVGQMWDGMGERGKSQMIGTAASMFSGAQGAANNKKQMEMAQQKLNQTSYGSAIPRLSIINRR